MSIVRQDAWTIDEDLVLAEVVLRHIREGSTQLAAFEEVGERLSRTAAACGFRWNSSIRKKYEAAIAIAKKQRKNLKKTKLENLESEDDSEISEEIAVVHDSECEVDEKPTEFSLNIDDVIEFLSSKRTAFVANENIVAENFELKAKLNELTVENNNLSKSYTDLKNNYEIMKQDYQLLIGIMDRAKQLSVKNG